MKLKNISHSSIMLGMIAWLVVCGCGGGPKQLPLGPVAAGDGLRSGTYEATETVWPVKAHVIVTIADGRITDIKLSEHRSWKGRDAGPVIIGKIIEQQSTEVDAVSGATMSSQAIMRAVQTAIDSAR